MEPGYIEVTHSQSETIGLPNWSFYTLMVSAKSTVPHDQYATGYDFLFQLVNGFLKERIQKESNKLLIGVGLPSEALDPTTLPDSTQIAFQGTELVFSIKEVVGLENKAKIEILESSKATPPVGKELMMLNFLAEQIEIQLATKRDVVIANPRPWTKQS